MSLSVKFNGIELNQYINVTDEFTPFIGVSWNPELNSSASLARGSNFMYTAFKEKTIPMPFQIRYGIEDKYNEIEGILNVDEPKELIFGNMTDKVFYAIPSGNLDFSENVFLGYGTINWIVPDGLAHSAVEKVFPASLNADGIMEATIVNNGTADAPISYNIQHNHENGYVGIVSEHGAMQYGYVDELDGETRQKSEVLINYQNAAAFSAMTDGDGVLTEDFPTDGTFALISESGKQWLGLSNRGSGPSWHGASRQVTLPADSNGEIGAQNFYTQTRVWFETGRSNQTGLVEFVIGDEAGQLLASIHIIKATTTSNVATAVLRVGTNEFKRIEYNPTSKNVTTRDKGQIYIQKVGELFSFYFGGSVHSIRVSAFASKKAKTITVFLGQYGDYSQLVTRMYFDYLTFRKDNVGYWYDIPNRYRNGSVLYVDGETTKAYVDGIKTEEITGSDYFLAPPGETKVQFYYSDFSDPPPTIEARIREAYL